jgi:hypothetical protein
LLLLHLPFSRGSVFTQTETQTYNKTNKNKAMTTTLANT